MCSVLTFANHSNQSEFILGLHGLINLIWKHGGCEKHFFGWIYGFTQIHSQIWLTVIYGIGKSIKMHHAHLAALWLEGLSLGSNVLTFCLFRLQCLFQTFPQTNIQKKQGLLCSLVWHWYLFWYPPWSHMSFTVTIKKNVRSSGMVCISIWHQK